MKKLSIIAIVLLIAFSGFTLYKDNYKKHNNIKEEPKDIINEDKTSDIKNLVNDFSNRIIQETDKDNKVIDFNTKDELIKYVSEISNEDLGKEYVELLYTEKNNDLYLDSKEMALLFNFIQPFNIEKESDSKYIVIKHGENEVYGKYDIYMIVILNNDELLIEEININSETAIEKITDNDVRKDIDYKDLNSIYLLANKQNTLPSDFIPSDLVELTIPFVLQGEVRFMQRIAADAITELVQAAKEEGIVIYGRSGYRSYKTQKILFNGYVKKHGIEKANRYSAKPGQSEHQTGLALDVTAKSVKNQLTQSFGETKEGIWVKENAHRFGFIIRYPEGKEDITGYIYEPWHLRYLGKEVASEIYEKNITYEEYLNVDISN